MDQEVIQQKKEMEVLREQVVSLKQQARADREPPCLQAMQSQKQQTKDSEEKLQLQDMVGLLSTERILLMIGQQSGREKRKIFVAN